MAEIDVRKFVDINIQAPVTRQIQATRPMVILFTPEGVNGTIVETDSYEDAKTKLNATTFAQTLKYLRIYFANGGIQCKVIEGTAYSALTKAIITALDNEEIVIACVIPDADIVAGYTAMKNLAVSLNSDQNIYGINEKILLGRYTAESDTDAIKNFVAKYSNVTGAEMTIAAYLSQVNVYRENSVWDYCFTTETSGDSTIDLAEDINDTLFGTLMTNNYNVDINLGGAVRDLGGNCKDGKDVVNEYVRIILHQTLTQRLINLLTTKIKSVDGIAKIYNSLVQELELYRNSGYLTTDKIWLYEDWTVTKNQQQFTVISNGTPLTTGYYIRILPMSSLTAEQKTARQTPSIYVVIADQYGIRKIVIEGEVI